MKLVHSSVPNRIVKSLVKSVPVMTAEMPPSMLEPKGVISVIARGFGRYS